MITLNGNNFAANDKEFVNSLFTTGGTCAGYYKVNSKSINILNMQKEKVAVINGHGLLCKATKTNDGKWWYNFGDIKEVGKYESYIQKVNEPKAILKELTS